MCGVYHVLRKSNIQQLVTKGKTKRKRNRENKNSGRWRGYLHDFRKATIWQRNARDRHVMLNSTSNNAILWLSDDDDDDNH